MEPISGTFSETGELGMSVGAMLDQRFVRDGEVTLPGGERFGFTVTGPGILSDDGITYPITNVRPLDEPSAD